MRLDPKKSTDAKPVALWESKEVHDIATVAVTANAVLVTGGHGAEKGAYTLTALDPADGQVMWSQPLPEAPSPWGLAVDRDGRVVVTLRDGRALCFAP